MFFRVLTIVFILFAASANAQTLMPSEPELAAKAWVLMAAETGEVLLEHNADEQMAPASLTKMMTSYIVVEEIVQGRLKESDMVRVSVNAWEKGGAKSGSSTMFLPPKSEASVIDLLRGVIIQSGNDASIALAEHLGGSEEGFADMMNQQAKLLGMRDTYYLNATGWPAEGHVTTARDLAKLARAVIYDHPDHYGIHAEKYFEYNGINQPNRNQLLWQDSSVDGIKTGHTEEAGYCLVSSAERNDMRLIAVVLGANSTKARTSESKKLLTYGFRYFETLKLYSAQQVMKENLKVWYGRSDKVDVVIPEDVILTLPRGGKEALQTTITIKPQLEAPIQAGEELGRIVLTLGDKEVANLPLQARMNVEEAGLFARLWDWLLLLFSDIVGGDNTAE